MQTDAPGVPPWDGASACLFTDPAYLGEACACLLAVLTGKGGLLESGRCGWAWCGRDGGDEGGDALRLGG